MDSHSSQPHCQPAGSVGQAVAELRHEVDAAAVLATAATAQAARVKQLYDDLEAAIRALPHDRQVVLTRRMYEAQQTQARPR